MGVVWDGHVELSRIVAESLRFGCALTDVVDIAPGYTTRWRIMPTAVVARVLAEEATLEIEDRPPLRLRPGMATCLPAGVLHRYTHPRGGRAAYAHAGFSVFQALDPLSLVKVPPRIEGAAAERIGALLHELVATAKRDLGPLQRACSLQAIGLSLLRALVDCGESTPRAVESLRAAQRLAPVLAAIEADPAGFDLPTLARRARLSRSRLHAVFRQAVGCSPMLYARRRRLERARALLASSDLPIHEVAERAGFPDQFHFSRAFKRAHGASPSEYRAQVAQSLL
jgi:AraC-like DNA-binding protein